MWYKKGPKLMNVVLADELDMPVVYINDKHYAVPVCDPKLPIAVVIEVSDPDKLLLGDFYAIDWHSERLERISPIRPLVVALRALYEAEIFDLTEIFTRFDIYSFARYLAAIFREKQITTIEDARPYADELYTLIRAADVAEFGGISCEFEDSDLVLPDSKDPEDFREVWVTLGIARALDFNRA